MSHTMGKAFPVNLSQEAEKHARAKRALLDAFRDLAEDDEHLLGELEGYSDLYAACDAMVETMRRNEAAAAGLRTQVKTYAAPLLETADAYDAKNEKIKRCLLRAMQDAGERSIPRDSYCLTVKANGNPEVIIMEPALVPLKYMRHKPAPPPEPDKLAIRKALNDPMLRHEVERAATFANAAPTLLVKFRRGNGTS